MAKEFIARACANEEGWPLSLVMLKGRVKQTFNLFPTRGGHTSSARLQVRAGISIYPVPAIPDSSSQVAEHQRETLAASHELIHGNASRAPSTLNATNVPRASKAVRKLRPCGARLLRGSSRA